MTCAKRACVGWLLGLLGLVSLEGLARANPPPVPRLDDTFPPADDQRRADRSMTDAHRGPVSLVAYSRDGRSMASAGPDGSIKIWNARPGHAEHGKLLHSLAGLAGRTRALGFAPADKALLVVTDRGELVSWDPAGGERGPPLRLRPAPGGAAEPVFSPGPEAVLAGLAGREVALWNVSTGETWRRFTPADPRVRRLAFTPDGTTLATGTDGGAVQLWDVASGRELRQLEAGAPVRALAMSAEHLAAGTSRGDVLVWPLGVNQPARRLARHQGAVRALAFAGKGDQLGAAGAEPTVQVWDVATGQRLCTQYGHGGPILSLAFSPNGQKMASGSSDRSLRSWTVPLPPIAPAALANLTAAVPARATATPRRPRRLLVFWRADAILHKAGVPAASKAIELWGKATGAYTVEFSRDYEVFAPAVLARYDAIVMNSTAHIIMPDQGKQRALLDYVRGGGGVVGIHAAIDMFKDWPEGAEVVGATFAGHPWGPNGTWSVKLDEPAHPLLRAFAGKPFKMQDEMYELGEPYRRADRRVLLSLDVSDPATAGVKPLHRADRDFAVAWVKRFGGGRVFYGMFGHRAEPFHDPAIARFYLDGIQYALGDLDVPDAPRALVPEIQRRLKTP